MNNSFRHEIGTNNDRLCSVDLASISDRIGVCHIVYFLYSALNGLMLVGGGRTD